MKFASFPFFACWVQACYSGGRFTKCRFGAQSVPPLEDDRMKDSNVPDVEDEARYIASIKAAEYEMRPLVPPNWKENDEIIKAMVDEAEYNAEQAEKLSPTQLNGPNLEALEQVRFYSRQILAWAQQEAVQLRLKLVSGLAEPTVPKEDPHHVISIAEGNANLKGSFSQSMHPSQGPTASLGLCQADGQTSSGGLGLESPKNVLSGRKSEQNLEMSTFFGARVGKKITEELRDFLLTILPHHPPDYPTVLGHEGFIKTVLRAVDFLYKYRFINESEMNSFFISKPHMLSLTGHHIATTFLFFGYDLIFLPQFDVDLLVMSRETDHIRNCLAELNDSSRTWIIHFAFSSFHKLASELWKWEFFPSPLKQTGTFLTTEKSVEDVIESKSKKAMVEHSILAIHLPNLIKRFEQPPSQLQNESPEGYFWRVKDMYIVNFTLLFHILQNLCHEQDVRHIFRQNEQFEAKFKIFVIGIQILCLSQRWDSYSSYTIDEPINVFPVIQIYSEKCKIEEKIDRLRMDYLELQRELDRDDESIKWKNHIIPNYLLSHYDNALQEVLERMKENTHMAKGKMKAQTDNSQSGSSLADPTSTGNMTRESMGDS